MMHLDGGLTVLPEGAAAQLNCVCVRRQRWAAGGHRESTELMLRAL